ncbi:MAG: glycosyltransferase family 2 protein [Dehalococcoidales bacterium]|jgi:dolichol-phosphate mannosyltransferase
MAKTISIIVPAYKEKDNIGPLVERINSSLAKYDYEIVIVDDNSADGSEELVNGLAKKYPVKIIVRKNKRGLSSAVVDGIAATDSEFVIVMDADLQHPPEVLPDIAKALENHDFVMASRYVKGGSPGDWKLSRKIVSKVATLLALFIAPKIKDPMSGFFGFKRSVVDLTSLSPTGWKIGLEILVRNKFKAVTEVPYTFVPRARGESKLSRRIMGEYIRQLMDLYSFKYQILNFMVVGGIGYIINLGLYSLLLLVPALKEVQWNFVGKNHQNYLLPFLLSSLVAIVSNYLMNRASTFKGWQEQKGGFRRYMTMAIITLALDNLLLVLLVRFGNLPYVLAAALAILINFSVRYFIARSWVWKQKSPKAKGA